MTPFSFLQKRFRLILFAGIVLALLSLLTLLFLPREYRADADVLVITHAQVGADPYAIAKSAERVGENLAEVIGTNDFYQKVRATAPSGAVDWTYFEKGNEREKRKAWNRAVAPSVVFGTGLLRIGAYHTNAAQSEILAASVAQTLVKQGFEYVGGDVTIKLVNEPVASKWPVRPNVIMNALLAFFVGVVLMSIFLIRRRGA